MEYNALAIQPQLCQKSDEELLRKPSDVKGYICEQKYDGTRILPHVDDYGVKLFTRNGKNELSAQYPDITSRLKELNLPSGSIYDGELVFVDTSGNIQFQSALITHENAIARGLQPILMLFDIIRYGGDDVSELSLLNRKSLLEDTIFESNLIQLSPYTTDETRFYERFCEECDNGREGIVLKLKDSKYQENARNKSWLKFKRHDTMDCVILGMTEGTGKYKDSFGALILGTVTGNTLKVCGYCSGMTDSERERLYEQISSMDEYTYKKKFSKPIVRTVEPTLVVEVEYMELTEYMMMRHPRFVRIREDKTIEIPPDAYPTKTVHTKGLSDWGF